MARTLLPGLHTVFFPKLSVSAFFVESEGELTLVDAGLENREGKLLRAIRELGRQPSDVRTIVATHYHSDHVGGLSGIVAATHAPVYVHALDAATVRTGARLPAASGMDTMGNLLGVIFGPITPKRSPPAQVDHEVEDGAEIPSPGGLRVVHTPGHTPGHISLLWPEHGGVLIVGDALGNSLGKLAWSIKYEDHEQARASVRKLASLDFEHAVFGHGRLIEGRANAAFRAFVERMSR